MITKGYKTTELYYSISQDEWSSLYYNKKLINTLTDYTINDEKSLIIGAKLLSLLG